MNKIIDWPYFDHLTHYTRLYLNFFVTLTESPSSVSKAESQRICCEILNPLSNISNSIHLYGNSLNFKEGMEFKKKRGKSELMNKDISTYIPILNSNNSDRDTLIFDLNFDEKILETVFTKCYDPKVMSGMGSSCNKSAVQLAKNNINNERFFALLSRVNSGFEWLFFIASPSVFEELHKIAGERCKFTKGFETCYGPDATLAPIEDKAVYGLGGFAE